MSLRSMLLTGATLSLAMAAPLAAQSQTAAQAPEKGCCAKESPKPQAFKLTDEQKAKMETIRAKHAVELTAKRQALREAEKAFHKAVQSPDSTTAQLKQLHQPVADRQFDLMLAERALRLEMRAVLTPEQQAKADQFREMGHKRGKWQGKGTEQKRMSPEGEKNR